MRAAATEGRTPHAHDVAQARALAVPAPGDLGHEVFRQPQVIEGLLEGFGGVLRRAAISCAALLSCAAATLSGFDGFWCIAFGWGHGEVPGTMRILDGWGQG